MFQSLKKLGIFSASLVAEANSKRCRILLVLFMSLMLLMIITMSNFKSEETNSGDKELYIFNEVGMPDSAAPLDIVLFYQWNNLGACRNIKFFGGKVKPWGEKKTLRMDGQKAVCMDEKVRPHPGDCLVYSFGIHKEWSFDTEMLEYGCEVHGFDPSIEEPQQEGSKKFFFHKIGLSGKDETRKNGWQTKTLKSIMEMLGHSNRVIDILKIDIEGDEDDSMENILQSGIYRQVKQLAIETHTFPLRANSKEESYRKFKVLWKIEMSGFVRFSSQPNIFTEIMNQRAKIGDFQCYEIAWYNQQFL